MRKIAVSPRLQLIEKTWGESVAKLFYQWHWQENLKHQEIAARIGLPRPTITRWFKYLGIKSQPGTRFTNQNLLNVGPRKSPLARPKPPPREFPWRVNQDFFKTWSPEMAYVLGYIAADGCLIKNRRGACYLNIVSIDYDLIDSVRKALGSNHKLSKKTPKKKNHQVSFQLQIGSKEIFKDLQNLGLSPRKEFRLSLPSVPDRFLGDFARGFFDGDGNAFFAIYKRKNRPTPFYRFVSVTFTCGSYSFLAKLKEAIRRNGETEAGSLSRVDNYARLTYYRREDVTKLFKFFYGNNPKYFLKRKFVYFQDALEKMGRWCSPVNTSPCRLLQPLREISR